MIDFDFDGYGIPEDCDDANPEIHPGAEELCNGIDDNCDGLVDLRDGVGVCSASFELVPQIDVIFLVDDSCSMQVHQAQLSDQFPEPLLELVGRQVAFHAGILSTDYHRYHGAMVPIGGEKWLDETHPDPSSALADALLPGEEGSGEEQGLRQLAAAMTEMAEPGMPNDGFFRENTPLAVVGASNAMVQEDSKVEAGVETLELLRVHVPEPERLRFHSLVTLDESVCDVVEIASFVYLAEQTGGFVQSICDKDWTTNLMTVPDLVAVSHRHLLPSDAVPESIRVWTTIGSADPVEMDPSGFAYEAESRTLVFAEEVLAPVRATLTAAWATIP